MSLDFYPNSKYLVTSSQVNEFDSGIRFWKLAQVAQPSQNPIAIQTSTEEQQARDPQKPSQIGAKSFEPQHQYDLQGGHTSTVNVVRFSPDGQHLASGSDDQMVSIWQLKMTPVEFGKTEETVQWGHPRQLRGHIGDVIDLNWSNDSQFLVSGSLDGTSILWSIQQGKYQKLQTFEGHRKFVQGVSIDPFFKFVASQSSDSTVRIYKNRKLKNQVQFFHKFTMRSREEQVAVTNTEQQQQILAATAAAADKPMDAENAEKMEQVEAGDKMMVDQTEAQAKQAAEAVDTTAKLPVRTQRIASHRLFLDDVEYQSFVRRLDWSPDGNLLLTPSACYYDLHADNAQSRSSYTYTVYGFLKHGLSQPALMLPGLKTYATCIKFNPYLFEKSTDTSKVPLLDLPYRMIFAVATTDQVLVYSTDQQTPIAVVGNIHYAPINDLAWCGTEMLIACSSDGYCSMMTFNSSLLGPRLPTQQIEDEILQAHYTKMDSVDFKRLEMQVKSQKSSQFQPIAFRKKTTQATPVAPVQNENQPQPLQQIVTTGENI